MLASDETVYMPYIKISENLNVSSVIFHFKLRSLIMSDSPSLYGTNHSDYVIYSLIIVLFVLLLNKCSVLSLQVLGFEVDSINSVQFSNHTGVLY